MKTDYSIKKWVKDFKTLTTSYAGGKNAGKMFNIISHQGK